jgi:hypothetical protein
MQIAGTVLVFHPPLIFDIVVEVECLIMQVAGPPNKYFGMEEGGEAPRKDAIDAKRFLATRDPTSIHGEVEKML